MHPPPPVPQTPPIVIDISGQHGLPDGPCAELSVVPLGNLVFQQVLGATTRASEPVTPPGDSTSSSPGTLNGAQGRTHTSNAPSSSRPITPTNANTGGVVDTQDGSPAKFSDSHPRLPAEKPLPCSLSDLPDSSRLVDHTRLPDLQLQLHSLVGHGRTYDAYRGTARYTDGTSLPVIAKFTNVLSHARQAVLREAKLYTGPLAKLQGSVVPRFYGLWHGYLCDASGLEFEVYVMLLEDVGGTLADVIDTEWWRPAAPNKDRIARVYAAIHDAGVVHMDTETWNVCLNGSDTRLIGFERSLTLDDEQFDIELAMEKQWVADTISGMTEWTAERASVV